MIAVLYKVDYAVQNGSNNPACTSIPCGWNQSTRKDVEPRKIIDLNLRRDKASKAQADSEGLINEAWLNFDPRKEGQRDISEQRKKSFLEGLKNKAPDAQIAGKGFTWLMESKDWRGFEYFSPISLLKCRTGVPADLDPPTKLSENVIFDVLTEIDNTLRSNAY